MRLINTVTLELKEFLGSDVPPYAILSHTWGGEELSLQNWQAFVTNSSLKTADKLGCIKIRQACHVARDAEKELCFEYLWVDTVCIDKSSSAELSEAINSMFAWYRNSQVCYVYLEDYCVDPSPAEEDESGSLRDLTDCRWFSRGWTLQELLAPENLSFYDKNWHFIGTKATLGDRISRITGIDPEYLSGQDLQSASVSQRMSWAAKRETTRTEDAAYCLLGIFDINMPLLYGEGDKAFRRLQEEIIKVSTDQTIFAWSWTTPSNWKPPANYISFLAPGPYAFKSAGHLRPVSSFYPFSCGPVFSLNQNGLLFNTLLLPTVTTSQTKRIRPSQSGFAYAVLFCRSKATKADHLGNPRLYGILVAKDSDSCYVRMHFPSRPVPLVKTNFLAYHYRKWSLPLNIPRAWPGKASSLRDELFFAPRSGRPGCHLFIFSFLALRNDIKFRIMRHPFSSWCDWKPNMAFLLVEVGSWEQAGAAVIVGVYPGLQARGHFVVFVGVSRGGDQFNIHCKLHAIKSSSLPYGRAGPERDPWHKLGKRFTPNLTWEEWLNLSANDKDLRVNTDTNCVVGDISVLKSVRNGSITLVPVFLQERTTAIAHSTGASKQSQGP